MRSIVFSLALVPLLSGCAADIDPAPVPAGTYTSRLLAPHPQEPPVYAPAPVAPPAYAPDPYLYQRDPLLDGLLLQRNAEIGAYINRMLNPAPYNPPEVVPAPPVLCRAFGNGVVSCY